MSDDVFPDRGMEHRDKIAWMVETSGWAVEAVPPRPGLDPPVPGYTYTVGLETAFDFPEVVVFGLTPVAARGLLGLVADLLAGGTEIPVGPVFAGLLDGDQRSALLPVDLDQWIDLFETATSWHRRTTYRVVQLAWPDRAGWLPWEPGFDHRLRAAQPVVGRLEGLEGL
jgi:hypothetical protein